MNDNNIIECKCGRPYKKSYIKNHVRSNEHKYFIEHDKIYIDPKYKKYDDKQVQCLECNCIISDNLSCKQVHENSAYHNQYMNCAKGESFTYKVSKYENNGYEKYITVHKK